MKRCVYCAEEIQDAAILCRFCGRDQPVLAAGAPKAAVEPPDRFVTSSVPAGFFTGRKAGDYYGCPACGMTVRVSEHRTCPRCGVLLDPHLPLVAAHEAPSQQQTAKKGMSFGRLLAYGLMLLMLLMLLGALGNDPVPEQQATAPRSAPPATSPRPPTNTRPATSPTTAAKSAPAPPPTRSPSWAEYRVDGVCVADLQCLGDKFQISAGFRCKRPIESMAKYTHEWTDGIFEPKFSNFRWLDKGNGIITYIGDSLRMQNGFGAWQNVVYECDLDTRTETVIDARVQPGRFSQ